MPPRRRRVPGKPSAVQAAVARQLGPLDGERIPGGCEHCDAYQTVSPIEAGAWTITVHHDHGCPVLSSGEGAKR